VALDAAHRVSEFVCKRSARVTNFLRNDAASYVAANYSRVFILPDPNNAAVIWGYYTLSATSMPYAEMTGSQQKKVPNVIQPGIPAPLALLGYMGRDSDKTESGFGEAIIVDAARRVYHSRDIAAWGIILDAENRAPDLMKWYEGLGFKVKAVPSGTVTGVMWAPLSNLIPELNPNLAKQLAQMREKARRARERARAQQVAAATAPKSEA
jgi:hypothetical protein